MPDIGDDVTIDTTVLVDGALADPSTISISVTAPSGTISTPAVTRTDTGLYRATVAASEASRWRYTWTTTGPAGKQHGYFDVLADPPPPDRLAPLATIGDLIERNGPLTDAQLARADALLRDASAKIRGYTKQQFDLALGDTATVRPVGMRLRLPQRPVLAVHEVVAVGGAGQPDITLPATAWRWDGLDEIELDWCGVAASFKVTYDHGNPITPDDVVGVCCTMVLRTLNVPTKVEGLVQERIGQYAYGYGQGPGQQSPGATVKMIKDDRDELAHYRRRASTIALRAG